MRWFLGAALAAVFLIGLGERGRVSARGAEDDATAVLDKAIKALGGAEKLRAAKAVTWASKTKLNIGGNDGEFTNRVTVDGLHHFRQEFDGQFGGNPVNGITVVDGDKGWRKLSGMIMELDGAPLANQKRTVYLQVIPTTIVPLKEKGFKAQTAGEEEVGGKPAVVLKVTPPDGKDFTLYFDKQSGLPVKLVAKVVGVQGEEYTQHTTFADYKDFGGIHKATKISASRDGEPYMALEITEFKVLDHVDPKTFAEPK